MQDDRDISGGSVTAMRVYKLFVRTVHLIAIAGLVGGHMFGAPLAPLRLLLYVSIATGAIMCGLEAYPNRHFFAKRMGLTALVQTRAANVGRSVLERSQTDFDRSGCNCVSRFAPASRTAALDPISQLVTVARGSVIATSHSVY
jgi:hypothetical protein